ncbi:MAG: LysM peptidoglycan-binding domain-containing protein [Pseudomonadales bacterium]|nr:LysM peptidoglycan-binding domain-containing protein [Pseudomonadales bacterium]
MRKTLLALVLALAASSCLAAGDHILRPGHPDRYTVKKGDTLWDIASMFLQDAWMWPEIWHVNPEIENPHLIYPGDTIYLTFVDGEPRLSVERGDEGRTTKLTPSRDVKLNARVRSSPLASSIPAIPLDAIASLLTTGRIVEQNTLRDAPHVLAGTADRLVFGPSDEFYARGKWPNETTQVYGIFREGQVYRDPETREILGYEAIEVGTASVEAREGDVYRMSLNSVKEEVRIGDRLLPTEERRVESTFYPSAPAEQVNGVIMTVLGGVTQVGRNDVVAVNRGLRHGLDVGNVLAIAKNGVIVRDQIYRDRVKLPSERAGLLMIFRSFDKMSYGLVLETTEPLRVGDIVENP